MKLLEHEAKSLLSTYQLPVPRCFIVDSASMEPAFLPCVLKSQVPTGGRGKAGGVKVVNSTKEFHQVAAAMLQLDIKGYKPQVLLAEEVVSIKRELYVSLLIDYSAAAITVMSHPRGGVEVEANNSDDFLQLPLDDLRAASLGLSEHYDLAGQQFALEALLEKLGRAFRTEDALLLEINPLILTTDNQLVIGDSKMEVDNASIFRHPTWQFADKPADVNFVTLNTTGNTATIANGAGLAMATVDSVYNAGLVPANFLDVGGGANEASVLAAFRRIKQFKNVTAIVINIFAGITRCDEIAKAILAARQQITDLPPLYIHLEGTNFEAAAAILSPENITLYASLDDSLAAATEQLA